LLATYFVNRRRGWDIAVGTEIRVKLRDGQYLIPDIVIAQGQARLRGVITTPPLIWIEILSPEDRPLRVNAKVRAVLEFGVPYVWVIDPETLESELHTRASSISLTDRTLRIPGAPIEVPLAKVYED